ncbi:MAG: cell division protein FtsQ/DivIB [Planctomycetota bacterium]|jgi:hypothetical protein
MARTTAPPSPWTRLSAFATSRHGRVLVRCGAAAIALLVVALLLRQARAQAYRLDAYRLGPANVRFRALPRGQEAIFDRALRDPRWFRFSVSVFDAGAEDRIREALCRHPLVEEVRSVTIRFPQVAEVRVSIRRPAAWFEVPTAQGGVGYVLVSADARVLDPAPYRRYLESVRVPLPVVAGVEARAPLLAGQAWNDLPEQVAEGLAAAEVAARLYRDFRGELLVSRIDVSQFPATAERRRDGEVRLALEDGTVIEWGRTERALAGVASEDLYETKRWRLETLLKEGGHRGGRRLEVRFRLPGEARRPGAGR